jgi:hypothetical protein
VSALPSPTLNLLQPPLVVPPSQLAATTLQPPLVITRQVTLGPIEQALVLALLLAILRRLGILPSPPPDLADVAAVLQEVQRCNPARLPEALYWLQSLQDPTRMTLTIA